MALPCSFAAQTAPTIREPATTQKERCAAADGYLSDSCEYWQAANRMRTDCSHLTVEAYYAAAEAAWNAIWTAPESPAVVEDATNAYGDEYSVQEKLDRYEERLRAATGRAKTNAINSLNKKK